MKRQRKEHDSDDELREALPAHPSLAERLARIPLWQWALMGGGVAMVLGLMVIGALSGGTHNRQAKAPADESTYDVSTYSSNMMIEYDENAIAADHEYKGKVVRVQGPIIDIGREALGRPYVVLGTGAGQLEIAGVQCVFSLKHEDAVARLSKGQQITIQGRCRGKLFNVLIEDCRQIQ